MGLEILKVRWNDVEDSYRSPHLDAEEATTEPIPVRAAK